MKITYLAHSGFLVELDQTVLLFDYYRGELPPIADDKILYVFVSHHHPDHFNPAIFQIDHSIEQTRYILAYDIKLNDRSCARWGVTEKLRPAVHTMRWDETEVFPDGLKIETLKSTDEGVAFLVTAEGHPLYHAGDLNWWLWKEEGTVWNRSMTTAFQKEIARIAGRELEAAFLPLDDRQGEDFYKGMDWYLRSCRIRYAFPMHFWEDRSVIERFEQMNCRHDYETILCDTAHESVWEI